MSAILYSKEYWGICKCGHYDWMHSEAIQDKMDSDRWIRSPGHGECEAQKPDGDGERCDCRQFTWVGREPSDTTKNQMGIKK